MTNRLSDPFVLVALLLLSVSTLVGAFLDTDNRVIFGAFSAIFHVFLFTAGIVAARKYMRR